MKGNKDYGNFDVYINWPVSLRLGTVKAADGDMAADMAQKYYEENEAEVEKLVNEYLGSLKSSINEWLEIDSSFDSDVGPDQLRCGEKYLKLK